MMTSHRSLRLVPSLSAALGAFDLSFSVYAQELNGVAHQFLQRHGVPCVSVLKVGYELGDVAFCEDGRNWALFWVENEIAFVNPQTREPYKWDRQTYLSYPQVYVAPDPNNDHQRPADMPLRSSPHPSPR